MIDHGIQRKLHPIRLSRAQARAVKLYLATAGTSAEMAKELGTTLASVALALNMAQHKLGLSDRVELAECALRAGLPISTKFYSGGRGRRPVCVT